MKIMNYLYYWFYHYYAKKCNYNENDSKINHHSMHTSASIALSALLFLFIYCLTMILCIIVPFLFSIKYLIVIFFVVLCILLLLFTMKYYKNKIVLLDEEFKALSINNKLKGWMVFLFMYSLFLFPIFFSCVYHLFSP